MSTPESPILHLPSPEEIFHQAREIADPAERLRFLDQVCAGRPEVRSAVDALLAAAAAAGSFMETRHRPPPTQASSAERPGQTIGRYKLLQLIGEGGFGAVFMAEQAEPVRRRVALKIIKPGMDSRMVAARFEAERQALALMDHPHIARVLDGGITDAALGARPYFVMEYVIGDPITKFADAHRLDIPARLELFTQVCQAVQHAHTKGIIHRDLKPGNILVAMTDGKPFAKVIDFGIAKSLASRLTEKTLFTEHRQLIGTPEYMSPEQAEGSPDIDTRTDVYALGVLLYELLTGATPFDAERLRSAAFAELQRIIKEEDPPAPSVRIYKAALGGPRGTGVPPVSSEPAPLPPPSSTLASIAASRSVDSSRLGALVKGELDWIVMKALDKDRARRYESPSQLAQDITRHLAGDAILAAPASAAYRLRKFVRRHRGPVLAGAAVAAALLVGIAATTTALYIANYNAKAAINNARAAESANTSLIRQRDLAIANLEQLACGLAQDDLMSGHRPDDGVFYWTGFIPDTSQSTPQGVIVRLGMDDVPELVFYRGSAAANPLETTDPSEVDSAVVTSALRTIVDGALKERSERRRDLEAANALLREKTAQARLAQARIVVDAYERADAGGADDEYLTTLDLPAALAARTEYLGTCHAETVRAEWALFNAPCEPETQPANKEARLLKLHELIARRDACGDLPVGIDIRLWSELAADAWRRGNLEECLIALHRVGTDLCGALSRDPRGVTTVPYPLYVGSVTQAPRTPEACEEHTRWLRSVTLSTLHRQLAALNGSEPSLSHAEALDTAAGLAPHPANLAMRAILRAKADPADPAAVRHLEEAVRLMHREPWAKNQEALVLVAHAENAVRPKLSPEDRLAEETKRRKLAEAEAMYRQARAEELSIPETASLLETVVQVRMEYLGLRHLDTADALQDLAQYHCFHLFEERGLEEFRSAISVREELLGHPDSRSLLWETFRLAASREFVNIDATRESLRRIAEILPLVAKRGEELRMYGQFPLPTLTGDPELFTEEEVADVAAQYSRANGPDLIQLMVESALTWMPTRMTTRAELRALEVRLASLVVLAPDVSRFQAQLGGVMYRREQSAQAIAHLDSAIAMNDARGTLTGPLTMAYRAMTIFNLGHTDEARAALTQLRALMADPANAETFAKDPDAQALLAEAEALIEGKPQKP